MERTKIDEVEGFDTPVDPDECDKARLIGEVVAEIVIGLGNNQAIMPSNLVKFAPAAERKGSGRARGATRAILDAESGGDALSAVPCGNFVIPRAHGYAARSSRGSRRHASQLSGDTSPPVASAICACEASEGILPPRDQWRMFQGLSEC